MTTQTVDWPAFRRWLTERMLERGYSYRRADLSRDTQIRQATISAWFDETRAMPNPPSEESVDALALWANLEPPAIYAILGVPVPASYDALRFRVLAYFAQLTPVNRERAVREVESIYVSQSRGNRKSKAKTVNGE